MTNDLRKLSKDLKAFAKRCKDFKYTEQMLFVFLLCGILSFSDVTPTDKAIQTKRQEISTSIGDMRQEFKKVKSENDKLVKNYNLELIQLMEQGDQAVKSPWSNWQYGMNFFYNDWQGKYKGRGDKTENIKYKRDASSKFGTFDGGKYGTTALNNKVIEPISAVPVDAAVKPKDIHKTALNINLPKIGAPVAPNLNISVKAPEDIKDVNVNIPNIQVSLPTIQVQPFNSFTFQDGRNAFGNTNFNNSSFYLGVDNNSEDNPTKGSYEIRDIKISPITASYIQNFDHTSPTSNVLPVGITKLVNGSGTIKGAALYTGNSTLENVNLYLAGNDGSPTATTTIGGGKKGVIGIHTVSNVTLKNIKANLYGQADFVSIETWHNGTVTFQGTNTVNVKGEKNTLFYIYPSYYEPATSSTVLGTGSDYTDWNAAHQRGGFVGSVDANISTNNNTIYSVMGIQGAFNINSQGTYKLAGAGNIVYSGLGYSPNYAKIQGNGGTGYDKSGNNYTTYAGVKFTPAIQLTKAPESYGDNNIILFFSEHTNQNAEVWGATNDAATWKKSTVGIYQGEISAKAIIGEHTNMDANGNPNDNAQTNGNISGGYDSYVENNVGIYSRSGQRAGISAKTDLGATDQVTTNGNNNSKVDFDTRDKIHSLEVNNIDIKFGKKSLSGIMVAAENGTLIDVASTHNSHVSGDTALAGTAIQNTAIKDYSSTTVTPGTISDNDTTNKAGTGTIVAYADGQTVGYVAGKMSQINLGQDVETASRYKAITTGNVTKEYYPVAYVAKNNGVITVAGDTTAKGYKQIIGYAENGGKVKLGWVSHNDDSTLEAQATGGKGKITAVDELADTTDATTKSYLYGNVGAYAKGSNSEIDVYGDATINGLGALANGSGATVNLRGTGNTINTGTSGALVAQNGGVVNFYGGTIVNKDNSSARGLSENDHKNVTPFYAKGIGGAGNGTIVFQPKTGGVATKIEMYDGVVIADDPSQYEASATATTGRYKGLENVDIDIKNNDVIMGVYDDTGKTRTWYNSTDTGTAPATFTSGLEGVNKFHGVTYSNGATFYTVVLKNGKLNVNAPTVTLDDINDKYNGIKMANEVVTISNSTNVTGNVSSASIKGQGLSMGSLSTATSNATTGFVNEGTINVTGGTAANGIAGMNVSYGTIKNGTATGSTASVTIDNGAGIYGTNGSKLENYGTINVTGSGAGIAARGTDKSVKQHYGTDVQSPLNSNTIEIDNHGTLTVAGSNPIGIYADNNTRAARTKVIVNNDAQLTVGTDGVGIAVMASNIESGQTQNGLPVAGVDHGASSNEGGTITVTATGTGSDIITGVNGKGIYAQNSDINLVGNYIIETPEKGIGIFASGNTNVTGTLEYKYNGSTTGTGMGIVYDQIGAATHTNNANVKLTNATNTTGGMVGVYTTAGAGNTLTNNGDITGSSTALEFGIVSDGADIVNNKTITLGNAASQTDANVGIYSKAKNTITNNDKVTVGDNAIGIYGYNVNNNKDIKAGDNGVAIYTQGSGTTVSLNSGSTITVGKNQAVGVYAVDSGQNINANAGSSMTIGDNSFGIVNVGSGNTVTSNTTNPVTLGTDAVYIYQNDNTGHVFNYTPLTSTGDRNYGLYGNGTIENHGNIDFSTGNGNVGIYSTGGIATNYANIKVGASNTAAKEYGVGMATGYYDDTPGSPTHGQTFNQGTVINRGTIEVSQPNTMGMYAVGKGSKAINYDTINLSGSNTIGMYIDRGATGENWGTIQTTASGLTSVKGIYVANGSYVKNYGTINIGASDPKSAGVWTDTQSVANVDDTATGTLPGTTTAQTGTSTPRMKVVTADDMKEMGGITIKVPPRMTPPTVTDAQGNVIPIFKVDTDVAAPAPTTAIVTSPSGITSINLATSNLLNFPSASEATSMGMYVDTSGVNYTNPIQGLSNLTGLTDINLFFGTEASRYTTARAIEVGDNILKPYNDALSGVVTAGTTLNVTAASLTWMAQPTKNAATGLLDKVYLVKVPYTMFANKNDTQTFNFLTGLEQKYGQEGLGTREKAAFDKISNLSGGEGHILAQAFDEMKGHQYSNIQQRTKETGDILSQEFNYLQDEWRNPTKDNNKIKMFGHRGEYNTDTAGVVDYTDNAYGVAYVHENETVKLGRKSGWYAGAVTNRFEFKDLGKSKETQTMIKAGLFKTVSPYNDHNGSLTWTIAGEAFAGVNNMTRRYWIVDDTFEAKSDYTTYGVALKNEIGKDFRTSERTSIRPYGALNLEYGRYSNIKEDGPMALEVKGNDYFSVQPELGVAFNYSQPVGVKSHFKASLTAAYTNELGEVNDVRNKARLKGTTADYYELRGDKEDRKGNGKFDLNIGFDNTRFGVTVNAGYDTKGENIRGGIGFRAIY